VTAGPSIPRDNAPAGTLWWVCLAVFLASTPWFAGTAVAPTLTGEWSLEPWEAARLTSAVQYGFIAGTASFAVANVADRVSARRLFMVSACAAAVANLGFAVYAHDPWSAWPFRFATGVAMAGVYPVAMKIIAAWYADGLGWRLGAMVAALTLGTGAPYLLRWLGADSDWRSLAAIGSVAAILGGVTMGVFVRDGPLLPARAPFRWSALREAWSAPGFRAASLGYFGHMVELYAVWSLIGAYVADAWSPARASVMAFVVVGVGAVGCLAGGRASAWWGERSVARVSLAVSGGCCVASPWAYDFPPVALVIFLVVWGVAVVADSAQFSALAAASCPPAYTGSALTMMNGVGFLITGLTIAGTSWMADLAGWRFAFLPLALGPLLGLVALRRARPTADRPASA